ncbi:MAG: OmpA family protein [Flavobacteriaceae bacterium]|nr:OmpA family protein [Flavobacteriaceae bacterium]
MKNFSLKVLAFLAVSLLVGGSVFAQTKDNKWSIGLHANQTNYQGDLGNEFLKFKDIDPGVSLSLGYYLSPSFDVTAKAGWSHVDYQDKHGTFAVGHGGVADLRNYNNESWSFYGGLWNASANLKFKLNNGWLLKEDAFFAPFAIGGVGVTHFNMQAVTDHVVDHSYSNLALYYGGGINFRLSERLNMVLEAGIYNPMTDVYDGVDVTTAPEWNGKNNNRVAEGHGDVAKSNDEFLQYSIGFTYNLGKKKDADGDGIADRKDKCPNTPAGVAVDEDGCPLDTDGDGVADYLDKCPNVAGTVNGCPDKDKDGIADKDDACPNVKGIKALKGCPDTDGDGVADGNDKCPNTPRGVKVDSKGCPVDTDGDGIADYLDKCPREAGIKEENGCPKREIVQAPVYFDRIVYFNFAKSYVRRNYIQTLNEVVAKMKENTTLRAKVSGYTDSIGSDSFNQRLSERRAKAVKRYLVSKGISADRIDTYGYGESNPVDSNSTAKGRANNRRAEVRIRLN